MLPLIIIGSIVAVPILLALVFRVNALYLYFSICVGYFLQSTLSDDVDLALATLIRGSDSMVIARLTLLALPILITIFVLRKTQGKSFVFQFVPLILSGLFVAVLALPLLPTTIEQNIYASQFGEGIRRSQDLIVAAASVSNLALAFILFKHKQPHGKHH